MLERVNNPIEKIADEMPNGFHDACLYSFSVDVVKHEAILNFGADVSDPEKRENNIVYRNCRLLIFDVVFFVVEPYKIFGESKEASTCDLGVLEGEKLLSVFHEKLPEEIFANWIFLNKTNSFIYFAAGKVKFEWL